MCHQLAGSFSAQFCLCIRLLLLPSSFWMMLQSVGSGLEAEISQLPCEIITAFCFRNIYSQIKHVFTKEKQQQYELCCKCLPTEVKLFSFLPRYLNRDQQTVAQIVEFEVLVHLYMLCKVLWHSNWGEKEYEQWVTHFWSSGQRIIYGLWHQQDPLYCRGLNTSLAVTDKFYNKSISCIWRTCLGAVTELRVIWKIWEDQLGT